MPNFKLMVAGWDYHQRELASCMTCENYVYDLPKSELIDEVSDINEKVYQYDIEECALEIKHEPGNKYDPAALQVYADDTFIGYVPRGNLSVLGKIAQKPNLEMSVNVFGGKYKYLEYDRDEDYYGTMDPKYFKVRTGSDPYRAIMIFEW